MALDVLSIQFKNHGSDKEVMKRKIEETRIECERLMHNLKSSNRLLDEANKEKRHAEIERDNLVKYHNKILIKIKIVIKINTFFQAQKLDSFYRLFNNANPNGNRSGSTEYHCEAETFEPIARQDTTGKKK